MNTEEAKLIYCHSSTTSFPNQPALTALQLLSQKYKEVEYDRGEMNNVLSIMAKQLRDERKRRVTFNNFSGWKHSSAIGDLIARFGFYSTLDIPNPHAIICSFCKAHYTLQFSRVINEEERTSPTETELIALHALMRKHKIFNSTCPRSLGLSGDNIPRLTSITPNNSAPFCYSLSACLIELEECETGEDSASDEYCNEESELRLEQLCNNSNPPYTTDLFSDILPLNFPMVLIIKPLTRGKESHSVDSRQIKARLELDSVRYILANPVEIIESLTLSTSGLENNSFFEEMSIERKSLAIRVAVECSLLWQLRSRGMDFSSTQDLLGQVWDVLQQMRTVDISSPVEFAQYYNLLMESDLPPQLTGQVLPTLPQTPLPPAIRNQPSIPRLDNESPQTPIRAANLQNSTVMSMRSGDVLCKVCLDQPANVIIIPCGHFLCCSSCLPQLTTCPICRKDIRGSIRPSFV